jgi:tRNA (adenine57-N1/adenine58-N1)-methyltransferase
MSSDTSDDTADGRPDAPARRWSAPSGANRPFAYGDKVLLLDNKQRRYLITLAEGAEFHSHTGFWPHADLVGRAEGVVMRTTKGTPYTALRPTLEDFVVEMPRGAQVIYPKDLATILMIGDIQPGVNVLESGIGSGALSMAMLRAGARITGYELREDFANRARANVRSFLGESALSSYDVHIRNCYDGIDGCNFDRVILDLPEPWLVVDHAVGAMRLGGVLVAYTPAITQAMQVRAALGDHWTGQRTLEVLHRTWHIDGQAVRPDHRMVAHTGFLTVARLVGKPD